MAGMSYVPLKILKGVASRATFKNFSRGGPSEVVVQSINYQKEDRIGFYLGENIFYLFDIFTSICPKMFRGTWGRKVYFSKTLWRC
jgi:hypothetical protein